MAKRQRPEGPGGYPELPEAFNEASETFDLEALYYALQHTEPKVTGQAWIYLCGLLCGLTPKVVGLQARKDGESSAKDPSGRVRTALHKVIRPALGDLLGLKGWQEIAHDQIPTLLASFRKRLGVVEDWGGMIPREPFVGRTLEIAQLQNWILDGSCRLVTIWGESGMGKTELALRVGYGIKGAAEFDYIVWRSLAMEDSVELLASGIVKFMADNPRRGERPEQRPTVVRTLLDYLMKYRCLIILDSLETLFEGRAGQWRTEFRAYQDLFAGLCSVPGIRSCIVVTSQEEPVSFQNLSERYRSFVQSLELKGLSGQEAQQLLEEQRQLTGSQEAWNRLARVCNGNPEYLMLIAADSFDRDIETLLADGFFLPGRLKDVLEERLRRLTREEKEAITWMALNQETTPLHRLEADVLDVEDRRKLGEALRSLKSRSLIEPRGDRYSLYPLARNYLIQSLIRDVVREIFSKELSRLNTHALTKTDTRENTRRRQREKTTAAIARELVRRLPEPESLRALFRELLEVVRQKPHLRQGYAAGNILNLLCETGLEIERYDFSGLYIRQAYLQGHNVRWCNFQNAIFDRVVFSRRFGSVRTATFSPNGKWLAFAAKEVIQVWSGDGERQQEVYREHPGVIYSVAFSGDETMLVSVCGDGIIKVWGIETGDCLATVSAHRARIWAVSFSADGRRIFTGSEDGSVGVWNWRSKELVHLLTEHQDAILTLSTMVAIDGREIIASGARDGTVKVWDAETGECLNTFTFDTAVASVTCCSDGQHVIGGGGECIKVFRIDQDEPINTLVEPNGGVRAVACSADGRYIASSSSSNRIKIWDWHGSSDPIEEPIFELPGHQGIVWALSFHRDGKALVSGGEDDSLQVWDLERRICVRHVQGYADHGWTVAFSPDGETVLTVGHGGVIRKWSRDGILQRTWQGHGEFVWSVVFSPNGETFASCSDDQTVKLWDVRTDSVLATLVGHTSWVQRVAFSNDGRLLASCSDDNTVRIWDVKAEGPLKVLSGHTRSVRGVAFHPDGRRVVSCGVDRTIRVWDIAGEIGEVFFADSRSVWSVALSPDGELLASSSDDRVIRIWGFHSRECLREIRGESMAIASVVFNPDGTLLAGCGGENDVRLWDVTGCTPARSLKGHENRVLGLAFSPCGRWLASCSDDETTILWNVATGEPVQVLRGELPYAGLMIKGAQCLVQDQLQRLSPHEIDILVSLGAIN